jgi:hypothetical protein
MTYSIYAALHEDINSGWVWVGGLPGRTVVCITNSQNGKRVYCEALAIDENFQRFYNRDGRVPIRKPSSSIVLNDWYRQRLGGLDTKVNHELAISVEEHWLGRVRSCLDHPQIVVRLATRLALWSVALGVFGVVLGALSLKYAI